MVIDLSRRMPRRKLGHSVVVLLSLLPYATMAQSARYEAVELDPSGSLRITTADRKTIVVPKEGEQSSFGEPSLSRDRTAVGAQANFPNCCTSYDIPLELVVYAGGTAHRFRGVGLPIFRWHFADDGTRIAYGQEPVHFGCEIHYELRDIRSERLIESADVPQPCGQRPDPPAVPIPTWVKELIASTTPANSEPR